MNKSLFDEQLNPLRQVMICLICGTLFVWVLKLFIILGLPIIGNETYLSYAVFFLVFIIMNALFSFTSNNYATYQSQSVLALATYLIPALILSYTFSGFQALWDIQEYQVIFIVLSISFFVFMAAISLVLNIVEWSKAHKSKIQRRIDNEENPRNVK